MFSSDRRQANQTRPASTTCLSAQERECLIRLATSTLSWAAFAGQANTTGSNNSFYGIDAGYSNTTGGTNAFFGNAAGRSNTTGSANALFGSGAGYANTTGIYNAFFGSNAGSATTTGSANSFVGKSSGEANTTGFSNAFFGTDAGVANTEGGSNSFIGRNAGGANTTGSSNSFLGLSAGAANTTGSNNTILGYAANVGSGALDFATAIGANAVVTTSNTVALGRANGADTVQIPGNLNLTGTFTGNFNANSITSGTLGTARGGTGLSSAGIAGSYLRSDGTNWASSALQAVDIPAGSGNYIQNQNAGAQSASNFNISGSGVIGNRLGVGISSPGALIHVVGSQPVTVIGNGTNADEAVGVFGGKGGSTSGSSGTTAGRGASIFFEAGNGGDVINAGGNSVGGEGGSIFLNPGSGGIGGNLSPGESGKVFVSGKLTADSYEIDENRIVFGDANNNTAIGFDAGQSVSTGVDNTFLGRLSGSTNSSGNRNTFIGSTAGQANASGNNNTALGYNANVNSGGLSFATAIGSNAIVTTSNTILLGRSSGADGVSVPGELTTGTLVIQNVGTIAGINSLCVTAANLVKLCSSSLRYKNNVKTFSPGLSFIDRLRPISYDWKDGGMKDVGFGAEDVAKINPRFVTYNDKGEVEGVKYDRLSVTFVNAFKEQQTQIEALQQQIKEQKTEIDAFKELICSQNPAAKVCLGKK